MHEEQSTKLNLGCGARPADGWINVDYALGARLAKVPWFRAINRRVRFFEIDWSEKIFLHDLSRRFPWGNSSVDVVYSSHTLEHLTKVEGRTFLSECHRVLRTNGIIRIVVPDLRRVVDEYAAGRIMADDFIDSLGVLPAASTSSLKRRLQPVIQYQHKCMYDTPRLLAILEKTGFSAASRSAFDSEIRDIGSIEEEARTAGAVVVEGRKE